MKMRMLLCLALFASVCNTCQAQFYDSTSISDINASKSASEGDLYLDTLNQRFFLGLSDGTVTRLNNQIDSLSFGYDSLRIFQGDSIYKIRVNNDAWNTADSILLSDFIYAKNTIESGDTVVITDD